MSRLFTHGLVSLLSLTILAACTPKAAPTTLPVLPTSTTAPEKPLLTPTITLPPGPSSLTVSATGGDLETRETQIALMSAINWKFISEEVLTQEAELVVLIEGEALDRPEDLVSDPETLQAQLRNSQTGELLAVTLIYAKGDDELLQPVVAIARNLRALGVQVMLLPVEAASLQKFIDTQVSAGEPVLLVNR